MNLKIPPLLLAAVIAALMYLLAKILPGVRFHFPFKLTLVAIFITTGVTIAVAGVTTFRRKGTTVNPTKPSDASSLVVQGIYRVSRNPMYLGVLLLLIAWGIYLEHLIVVFVLPAAFVIYMNKFQIEPEEQALQKLFGDDFASYKKKVRRWI